jgi:hypothetical protein
VPRLESGLGVKTDLLIKTYIKKKRLTSKITDQYTYLLLLVLNKVFHEIAIEPHMMQRFISIAFSPRAFLTFTYDFSFLEQCVQKRGLLKNIRHEKNTLNSVLGYSWQRYGQQERRGVVIRLTGLTPRA